MPALVIGVPNNIAAFLSQHRKGHQSVHKPLPALAGLLISLFSTFVLNVSEQPKSMRHIRKAAEATQRYQKKKIEEEPRRNSVPLDWTQE